MCKPKKNSEFNISFRKAYINLGSKVSLNKKISPKKLKYLPTPHHLTSKNKYRRIFF